MKFYLRLTKMRRLAADWYHLGLCQGRQQNFDVAQRSFMHAIRLRPNYAKPYLSLAKIYDTIDPARSTQLRELARQLPSQ